MFIQTTSTHSGATGYAGTVAATATGNAQPVAVLTISVKSSVSVWPLAELLVVTNVKDTGLVVTPRYLSSSDCDGSIWKYLGMSDPTCYQVHLVGVTWSAARAHCEGLNAKLIEPRSNNDILKMTQEFSTITRYVLTRRKLDPFVQSLMLNIASGTGWASMIYMTESKYSILLYCWVR